MWLKICKKLLFILELNEQCPLNTPDTTSKSQFRVTAVGTKSGNGSISVRAHRRRIQPRGASLITVTMKYLVVVLFVAACATAASAAATSCALSEEFFARHNISAHDSDNEPGADF
ncbi:unnamed protein product, partial [Brenthis ino]